VRLIDRNNRVYKRNNCVRLNLQLLEKQCDARKKLYYLNLIDT